MLNGALILIAEDQPMIAMSIALAVTDAGGVVVGPVASVKEALTLIATTPINAAILDVNLVDGDITPVAKVLLDRKIPLVLQSGVGTPPALAGRASEFKLKMKPYIMSELIEALNATIKQSA